MSEEFERFSKVIAENGGLPIDNDQLAATTVKDLVLDIGFDPHWSADILLTALDLVNQTFDIEDHRAVQTYTKHMVSRREADNEQFCKSINELAQAVSNKEVAE